MCFDIDILAWFNYIFTGDWLMSINDLEVTFDNFDSILSAISVPKQVRTIPFKYENDERGTEMISLSESSSYINVKIPTL